MPEVTVNKKHISLPWTIAGSAVVTIIGGVGIYHALKADVKAAQGDAFVAQRYAERVEADSKARFVENERRIEKLEDTLPKALLLLERIDERTLDMKRRMDSQPATK